MKKIKRKFIITYKIVNSNIRRDCSGFYKSLIDVYKNPPEIPKFFRGKNCIIEDVKTEEEFIEEIFKNVDNSDFN